MIIERTSRTPRTDAIMDCIDKSNGADTREHCYALQEAARNGIEAMEREVAALRELLGRFAEFERDADGYCDWCGSTDRKVHAADCIYPEVRAALSEGHAQDSSEET